MIINVQVTGMDMTPAIKEYCHEKAEMLSKYFDGIVQADINVGKLSSHHQKGKIYFAKTRLEVPGKDVFVEKEAEDLYKAIDKVKDHLKVELEKMKGKMNAIDREAIRESKAYDPEV